jgi:hypothetical protein
MEARCACGQLAVRLNGPTPSIAACHCVECRRRTGSAFGLGAYYRSDRVSVSGETKTYLRTAASGAELSFFFCPDCGSTLFWRSSLFPQRLAVAAGAIDDPAFPSPKNSLWEESKLAWVSTDGMQFHYGRGLGD